MKKQAFIYKFFIFSLFCSVASTLCLAYENPFLNIGATVPDGKLGAFKQNNTGDCFFLASLIALGQDPDGIQLLETAFQKSEIANQWHLVFPNLPHQKVKITQQEFTEYKLKNSPGNDLSLAALGDPDVRLLEIAADKIWRRNIKLAGLWDDVPMNALFMFSNTEQLLIWNRNRAAQQNIQDIDKYRRMPENNITELQVSSVSEAEKILQDILASDKDGISMILIDYLNYHAVAISKIDFIRRTYSFIGTYSNSQQTGDLNDLLQGIANGDFALNYLEIEQ